MGPAIAKSAGIAAGIVLLVYVFWALRGKVPLPPSVPSSAPLGLRFQKARP